jgi:hypothetical protein
VTLPGVGTLGFTVEADGTVDPTTLMATAMGTNFTAGTPHVSSDGTHVSMEFTNAAAPTQHHFVKAKVIQTKPTTVGNAPGFLVIAKAGPVSHHHHSDHDSHGHEHSHGRDH